MNILILGSGDAEQNFINLCLKSKYLDYIYTSSTKFVDYVQNITYNNHEELATKIKDLQIDIVIVFDKTEIANGIVEFLQKKHINVFSTNKKWLNLQTSYVATKNLCKFYSFNIPEKIKFPSNFPIILKHDKKTILVNTLKELTEIKTNLEVKNVFMEEFLEGKEFSLVSIWDGRNIFHYDLSETLTEVQYERLNLFKAKLMFMLSDEKADFMGFIVSKLIWTKNDWYILNFEITPDSKDISEILEPSQKDFLYLLNSAIYQKLNEI